MNQVVVDTSVAFKWFVREAQSDRACALADSDTQLFAPDLIVLELANALREAVLTKFVSPDVAAQALTSVRQTLDLLIETQALIVAGLKISIALRHPIYDCIYLAASRRLGAPLITADQALVTKLEGTEYAGNVILLADWKP